MTTKEKVEELIFELGIENSKYLINEILIVLNDYSKNDVKDWEEIKNIIDDYGR